MDARASAPAAPAEVDLGAELRQSAVLLGVVLGVLVTVAVAAQAAAALLL